MKEATNGARATRPTKAAATPPIIPPSSGNFSSKPATGVNMPASASAAVAGTKQRTTESYGQTFSCGLQALQAALHPRHHGLLHLQCSALAVVDAVRILASSPFAAAVCRMPPADSAVLPKIAFCNSRRSADQGSGASCLRPCPAGSPRAGACCRLRPSSPRPGASELWLPLVQGQQSLSTFDAAPCLLAMPAGRCCPGCLQLRPSLPGSCLQH